VPTYQYSCTECGHFFEQFQSFSEDSLTVCPQCQGRLRKVFNAVGVVFKGSGFYRTDSRSSSDGGEGTKPAASPDKSAAPKADGTGTGSGEGSGKTSASGSGSSSAPTTPAASGSSTSAA
jgi:putative FmdB family regulatory protein